MLVSSKSGDGSLDISVPSTDFGGKKSVRMKRGVVHNAHGLEKTFINYKLMLAGRSHIIKLCLINANEQSSWLF